MTVREPSFQVRLAQSDEELAAAQRLRYRVFVEELGGDGPLVDHERRLERDRFDPYFDHLLLLDPQRGHKPEDQVVGVYRMLTGEGAEQAGQFYSESEYDLTTLRQSGRRLLELGRSCVHAEYRGTTAMYHLWTGLADYVLERGIEILFGVASFHGTDVSRLAEPLSYLYRHHLAPPELRVRALEQHYQPMDLLPDGDIGKVSALRATPALIKAYLRLGGFVGDGAFVDHEFNTTDVCLVMDTERMSAQQKHRLTRGRAA